MEMWRLLVDPRCIARGHIHCERGKLLDSVPLDLRKQPEEAWHWCKQPKVKIGSPMIAGRRSPCHFRMNMQNRDVVFMKPNQVRKSAHDWFKLGESGAIALGDSQCAQRDLSRLDR